MTRQPLLDAPGVHFAPGTLGRLDRLVRRAAGARERGELLGRARAPGAGDEFVGFRPYRAGEDVRHLDWSLYARLERPYVRVHRREAGERWRLVVDTSPSMGLGAPGKLQYAAEVALAVGALGQAAGAAVELLTAGPAGRPRATSFARRSDLGRWIEVLGALESPARGASALQALVARAAAAGPAARVFVLGDVLALEPRAWRSLARPGRRLFLTQVLAPHELRPESTGLEAAAWIDRGDGSRVEGDLGPRVLGRYGAALGRRLEALRALCARHGVGFSARGSDGDFEDLARELARP